MASQARDLLKRLQHMQRLIERACAERDLAIAEAAHWKQRYETEAQQRRVERSQSDELIQQLAAGTQPFAPVVTPEQEAADLTEAIANGNEDLATLIQERAQLRLALEKEKENHQQTRASLITALGDALQRK